MILSPIQRRVLSVAVRVIRSSVPGLRAPDVRKVLDSLAVIGYVRETVDGRYVRLKAG